MFASLVRISSWIPTTKYSLSLSPLRFSNGSTAIDFSATAGLAFATSRCASWRTLATSAASRVGAKLGRTSIRERGCLYVSHSGVRGSIQQQHNKHKHETKKHH